MKKFTADYTYDDLRELCTDRDWLDLATVGHLHRLEDLCEAAADEDTLAAVVYTLSSEGELEEIEEAISSLGVQPVYVDSLYDVMLGTGIDETICDVVRTVLLTHQDKDTAYRIIREEGAHRV